MLDNQRKAKATPTEKCDLHPSISNGNDDVAKTQAVGPVVSSDSGTDVGYVSSEEDSDFEASVAPDSCARVHSSITLN